MKVFISADIEGCTTTTFWDETDPKKPEYALYAQRMTEEVLVACEGANAAGATEIIVRDAHNYGNNIDICKLPENVKIIRGWSEHPYSMVEGVPTVFLSGDKMLCEDSKDLHPGLITCPVKEGVGGRTLNYHPANTLKEIKAKVELALKQDLKSSLGKLPEEFELEVCYRKPEEAERFSYYPGVRKINDNTLVFKSKDYFEVLRTFNFIN